MDTNGEHPLRRAREQQNLSIDDLAEECGVSARTILRAEQGEPLYPGSRRQICNYFQMTPEELGLLPQVRVRKVHLSSPVSTVLLSGIHEMKRRELLQLLGVAAGALVLPLDLSLDWERLKTVQARPALLNDAVLQDCAAINRQFWQDYRAAAQKAVVLDGVLAHLQHLTHLLRNSHTSVNHQQLCILVSDLSQLLGEVCFDANLYTDAIQCYTFAAGAAREAKAYDLWACALTRHAFIPIYEQEYHQALPLLDIAGQIALRGDSTLATKYWVAVVDAEAQSGSGNLAACQQALDLAEEVRDLKEGTNGAWLRFDGARLPEERGACFVKLRQPDLAEPALLEALKLQSEPTRRRGMILTDLALVALQRGNIEQACTYGDEIVGIVRHGASGVLKRGLQTLQIQLKSSFKGARAGENLDQEIQTVMSF